MKSENKNLIVAAVCALAVMFGIDYFYPKQKPVSSAVQAPQAQEQVLPFNDEKPQPAAALTNAKDEALVTIKSDTLSGSIRLKGAVFNNLTFLKYRTAVKKGSPDVQFLNPDNYAVMGFNASKGVQVPDQNTVWQADNTELTPQAPVTLTWTNEAGVEFVRQISLDNQYMFTITDEVKNPANGQAFTVAFDGFAKHINAADRSTTVHQGFVGVLNGKLKEDKYASIKADDPLSYTTEGGWFGFGDKYWLSAFAFNPAARDIDVNVTRLDANNDAAAYQMHYHTEMQNLAAGTVVQNVAYFFAGPKDLDLLTSYQETLGIDRFELAIDFGWYYFLTKPFLYLLSWLYSLVGNMGVAILIFATLLRLLLLPIAGKSYESMAKMRKLQPKMQRLQEAYKNDKVRLNQEMLALYQKEKVNPASGCLPLLIQIPVFFSLYKVLSVSIEMRQAPFFGWIKDLSAPDPSSIFTLFGLVPWPIPSFLNIGVWPVLMGVTMYLQQKMSTQTTPTTAQNADMMTMMKWMPVIFTFMMGNFASGLVIYWTWSNILSIAQQRYVMKKYGVK